MLKLATFFLDNSLKNKSDYTKRYESMVEELKSNGDNVNKDRICKMCGGKMVLRTAKKGNNAGKQFFGCERFPECRYVENVGRME